MTHRRGDLVLFLLVAFGFSWLVALPLWFDGGLGSPLLPLVGVLMMATPTAGVLAVWRRERTPAAEFAARTGLGLGPRKGRTFALIAAAWLGVPVFAAVTMAVSDALGLASLDLSGLGFYHELLDGLGIQGADVHTTWLRLFVSGLTIGTLVTVIPAFGEEWGWRGWLLPRLTDRLGVTRGLLASGVIWGLWHAPLTLLGYNYANLGAWAALVFVGFCAVFAPVIGWLRLRSGSIWPAVVAHAAFNAVTPSFLLLGDAGESPNFAIAGPIGLVGWAVFALLGAALLRFRPVRSAVPS